MKLSVVAQGIRLLKTQFVPGVTGVRTTSFFNKLPAESLWKGVTSVSNAGKKRGRGKGAGRKSSKDLNKGQVIGVGKVNILWPGLNAPVIRGRELISQTRLPDDPNRQEKLDQVRNALGTWKRQRLSPEERGWSGNRLPGRKVGPPDPVGDDHFHGFETIVLEMKTVFNMTGNLGRKRQLSIFVVTGNGNGLAGFGLGKAMDGRAALKSAKNRAGQKLMFVERFKEHTVNHNTFAQFGKTKVFIEKKPMGYGLVCHRAIKAVCEAVGIKDLYAKVEGSKNLQHVIKAFFLALLLQKTPEELAHRAGLHVVELSKEKDNFPELIASPPEPPAEEPKVIPDFNHFVMDGRVVLKKKKYPPFYTQVPGWQTHLKKTLRFRNLKDVQLNLKAQEYLD